MHKIILIKEALAPMPLPPSAIIQNGSKYFYIYNIFQPPSKPWNIENIEIPKSGNILYENPSLVYNENLLWNTFNKQNAFENLINGSPDPILTHLIAGTILGNMLEDGKIWLFILGKASSGKTYTVNLFQSLEKQKMLYYVGKFTSAAFFSVRNYKDCILTQVQKGGTIICKDFSSFLARGMQNFYKIMNMLREIYDGFYEDRTVEGVYRWVGKIGLIICGTPMAQRKRAYVYEMGDRFVWYKINPIFQPVLCQADLGEYIINHCYDKLLDDRGNLLKIKDFPNPYQKEIELISEMIEICRTANPIRYRNMRDYIVEPNKHFRLMHQLTTLAVGMAIASGYNHITEKIIKRLMELVYRGSIERYFTIIQCIFKEKITDLKAIKRHYTLSRTVFDYTIEDLENYGLIIVKNDKVEIPDKFKLIFEKY